MVTTLDLFLIGLAFGLGVAMGWGMGRDERAAMARRYMAALDALERLGHRPRRTS